MNKFTLYKLIEREIGEDTYQFINQYENINDVLEKAKDVAMSAETGTTFLICDDEKDIIYTIDRYYDKIIITGKKSIKYEEFDIKIN